MDVRISQLPTAQTPITGTELVPIVQNGLTVQTTVSAITQSPNQTQPFLTVGQQPTLPNSRYFSAINGLQITDGGAQGAYTLQIVNNPTIPGNAGMAIPSGTTAQRNTTPAAMRLNVETKAFEGFDGTNWVSFITNVAPPLVTFSAGTTGFTPNVPTGNNVVLGGTLNVSNGGTGVTTLTGLAYGNGTSPFTVATAAQVVSTIGTTAVTNATNATNMLGGAAGSISYQSGANTSTFLSLGTADYVLTAGASAPQYVAQSTLSVGSSTNILGGANGSLPYQTGSGVTTFLAAGTNGYVLTLTGGVPTWANPASTNVSSFSAGTTGFTPSSATNGAVTLSGTLVVSNGGTGISTLTAGYIPYGAGTSAFASNSNFTYNTTNSTLGTPTLSVTSITSVTPALSFNASNTSIASGASVSGSYLQSLFQNKSASAGASVNYVLSNNLGTDSTYYGEFGMNSSVFSASTPADFFSINNGIYFSGHDGDLSVGSGNGFKTYLAWGTVGQSAHVINAAGAIGLSTNLGTTPALSGTTGFGSSGQVLTSAGSSAAPTWATPTTGTVTSVGGTGTVNGLSLSGTVTTSGNLTLGGTLSLISPPPIGTTTPAEVKVTTGWSPNFALTDAATVAWDSTNQVATFTFVSTNRTMGAPTNLKNGAFYALAVIQNGGSNTLTWNAVFKWAAGTAPTLSTAAGAKDYFTFRSDGTNLYQQGISQAVA